MSDQSHERRRFQRIPFDADAELLHGSQSWTVKLHDLSLKGLLVSRPSDWQAQTATTTHACLRLAPQVEVRMLVALAHESDDLLGFSCQEIDLDSITHLRRLLELNLGSSELLERDLSALVHG